MRSSEVYDARSIRKLTPEKGARGGARFTILSSSVRTGQSERKTRKWDEYIIHALLRIRIEEFARS